MMQFKPMTEQFEWDWFKEKTHVIRCEDTQGIVAFDERGIQAMGVFDTWTVDSCCVHLCVDNPTAIRRGLLHELGHYAFNVCGRTHMFGLVPSNNPRALKLNKHIGWCEVTTIPDGICTGVDVVVMRLNKEDCRWIAQPVKEEAA